MNEKELLIMIERRKRDRLKNQRGNYVKCCRRRRQNIAKYLLDYQTT